MHQNTNQQLRFDPELVKESGSFVPSRHFLFLRRHIKDGGRKEKAHPRDFINYLLPIQSAYSKVCEIGRRFGDSLLEISICPKSGWRLRSNKETEHSEYFPMIALFEFMQKSPRKYQRLPVF